MLELVYPIYYFVSKHATVECQLSKQSIIHTSHKAADSAKMDTSKRKRTAPSVDQKLVICKQLEIGASSASLSKELGLGKFTIYDIKHSEEKMVTFVESIYIMLCLLHIYIH